MSDDAQCPECGENAARGDCRCDGGDNIERGGVERYIEFSEGGRTQSKKKESKCQSPASAERRRR